MNPRSTNKPCPCGSGLIGLRNITAYTPQHVVCRKCRVPIPAKVTPLVANDRVRADAVARRRLEEMRDEREAQG